MEPQALAGGIANATVVRIGDRVHRAAGPHTSTVHRLLAHLRAHGLDWVPAQHGFDGEGREVLDFVPGEVAHGDHPAVWTDETLVTVASALRQWHDAAASFERTPGDTWWRESIEPTETVCHGDFAPYNHVFLDGRLAGVIDFDTCVPAPRLWDLGYAAYRYVPLIPGRADAVADGEGADRSQFGREEQVARLAALCAAYGEVEVDGEVRQYRPDEVVAWAVRRLDELEHDAVAPLRDGRVDEARIAEPSPSNEGTA
mgnify:CR=1 FL=1